MVDITLDSIKELRDVEEGIYNKLNQNPGNDEEQEQTLNQLKALSFARNNMFDDVVEKSIGLNELKTAVDNKKRFVEINTYYGKQYTAHTSVVMIFVYTFIAMFVMAFLRNRGILSGELASILVAITLVIGTVIGFYRVSDLSRRNNMDYDKYDWPGISNDGKTLKDYVPAPSPVGGESNDGDDANCVGVKCCGDGTTYSETFKKCIHLVDDTDDNEDGNTLETFTLLAEKKNTIVKPFSVPINFATM
jgi:hypothetical protein|tara:strand:- start:5552 stop:6295 length:744 start_codon:yes stop_codon:yes gene_type:complete